MATKQSPNNSSGTGAETNLTDATSVREFLQARLNPTVAASLDARLRLAWPSPEIPKTAKVSTTGSKPAQTQQTALPEKQLGLQAELYFELNFELNAGQLTWLEQGAQTQATFWFRDALDVGHLLSSSDDVYTDFMQRFMAAELSSDGHLPWAFTLLSLFRGGPSLARPD